MPKAKGKKKSIARKILDRSEQASNIYSLDEEPLTVGVVEEVPEDTPTGIIPKVPTKPLMKSTTKSPTEQPTKPPMKSPTKSLISKAIQKREEEAKQLKLEEKLNSEHANTEQVVALLLQAKQAVPDREKIVELYDQVQELIDQGADVSEFQEELTYSMRLVSLLRKDDRKKIAIVCYKAQVLGKWCPDAPAGAGSEEAVIFASATLAKRHQVTVFADPPEESKYRARNSNPRYTEESINTRQKEFDIIIMWRHIPDMGNALKDGGKTCLWLHDVSSYKYDYDPDIILFLSRFHHSNYMRSQSTWHKSTIKKIIAGNGLDYDPPREDTVKRKKLSCVYASNYSRGLIHLLRLWPEVRAKYPKATLNIAYGRETYGNLNDQQMEEIVSLIEQPGITEHGKLNYNELNALMQRCSLWTYPYSGLSETFCITAIRAQRCGLIPVTTREAALKETVSPLAFTLTRFEFEPYRKLLFKALAEEDVVDRSELVEFSYDYTWDKIVEKWEEEF